MLERIAVIGLGYVGLPLFVGLSHKFEGVVGFDIDSSRIKALTENHDWTGEVSDDALAEAKGLITDQKEAMRDCTFFIVTVPTPIDESKRPDLTPVLGACQTIGAILKLGATKPQNLTPLIVFESTVWPGLTEEYCGVKIEEFSGLKRGIDFKLGYSPERINPGDKVHRVDTITKVISAEDATSVDRLEKVYTAVITAGVHKAPSITVAEAAKVIENTQRDLNIALMNELALICDRLNIRTQDVLDAAGTKWNFLKFTPGLVGGHCIGVDPYYLTERAQALGYHPEVILAGRRINDNMPVFIAQKLVKLLVEGRKLGEKTKVGILGLSFKENVRDLRNSRIPDIVKELEKYGIDVLVNDPVADPAHAMHEYGLTLHSLEELQDVNALIFAVPHEAYLKDQKKLWALVHDSGFVMDVKSAIDRTTLPASLHYWSL